MNISCRQVRVSSIANLEHLSETGLDLHRMSESVYCSCVDGTARTPKVPRLLFPPLSFPCAVRVGAMTGVPEALPTPWGMGGRGEPPFGV